MLRQMTKHSQSRNRTTVRTSPLVLSGVSLMVYTLLNQMLVLRIVRVHDLDRLPPALAFPCIVGFDGERCEEHG